MEILLNEIKKIYNKQTYYQKYGGLIWIALLIIIVFVAIITYFLSKGSTEALKKDWINNRCKPSVMPFAGFINNPGDKTNMEYTQENFSYCIESILSSAFKAIIGPIIGEQSMVGDMFSSLPGVFEKLGGFIEKLMKYIKSFLNKILRYLENVLINIKKLLGSFSGIFNLLSGMQALFKRMILNALLTVGALMYWVIGKIRDWANRNIYVPLVSLLTSLVLYIAAAIAALLGWITAWQSPIFYAIAAVIFVAVVVLFIIYLIIVAILMVLRGLVDLYMLLVNKFR